MRLSAGPAASVVDARTEEVAWIDQDLEGRRPGGVARASGGAGTMLVRRIQSRAAHLAWAVTGCAAVANCCHPVFSTITSLFDTLSHAGRGVPRSRHLARVIAGRFLRHAAVLARVVGTWRAARG
jgi:hypothetical protein